MHMITFSSEKDVLTVFIERDIDHHTAQTLRDEIDKLIDLMPAKRVVLNFEAVEFMDSSGIGLILGRYKKCSAMNRDLQLSGLNPRCAKLAELSGVLQLVNINN